MRTESLQFHRETEVRAHESGSHFIDDSTVREALGVSQQTVNSYEVARRRVPVSALPVLARLLKVSTDELLGEQTRQGNGKRGPASKLQQQIDMQHHHFQ